MKPEAKFTFKEHKDTASQHSINFSKLTTQKK